MELAGPSVAGCECQTPLANSPSSCERAFFMDYGKSAARDKEFGFRRSYTWRTKLRDALTQPRIGIRFTLKLKI